MSDVSVTLPDGSKRDYRQGVSFQSIAEDIGKGLAKAALAVRKNGQLLDLSQGLDQDASLEIITLKSDEGLEIIRHSTAHVLAMAVQRLWPGTQVTIGPVIENGFYYDFSFPDQVKISEKDFPAIEAEMNRIIKSKSSIKREIVDRSDAIERFKQIGEYYKVELIEAIDTGEEVTLYHIDDWFDLCRGPHVPNLGKLGAFKLTAVAGAYWRGSEQNSMLTRIYGTAWADKKDLETYLHNLEEAKKRDHRVLGKQLDLFSFHNEAVASPFFHGKGAELYNRLVSYMRRSNKKFGFSEVATPLVMNVDMWHKSGHYDNYRENMYFTDVDDQQAAIKPMNCPGHCLIFSSSRHSYREMPLKMSEFGRVHRHERSGVTHGLFRVRSFVQDDAHVFCTKEQIGQEIGQILAQIGECYNGLGFKDYKMELSTRPEKSIGSDEIWTLAENSLKDALRASGSDYKLNPGDGAFYGPKIDFHLIDSLGRSWQCGTIQLDFSMPERFGLSYIGADDKPHTPVMIHRAVLGSIERFLGIFIEHYAGHFPLWAAPTQARIVNISEKQSDYCYKALKQLKEAGVRADFDDRNQKLGFKIREAQLLKIPYMLVVGDREMHEGVFSPRRSDGKKLENQSVAQVIDLVKAECDGHFDL